MLPLEDKSNDLHSIYDFAYASANNSSNPTPHLRRHNVNGTEIIVPSLQTISKSENDVFLSNAFLPIAIAYDGNTLLIELICICCATRCEYAANPPI